MKKFLVLPLILALASTARAELLPDQVAIVAMAQSQQSRQLAEYYASARGVPKSQILLLDGKPTETISRETWDREVRPAIYAWLMKNGLRDKVRCLVTTWDVPLKIGRRADDSAVVVERKELLAWSRKRSVEQLAEMLKSVDAQIPGGETSERPEWTAETAPPELTAQIDAAMKSAMDRTKAIESEEDKKRANGVLERGVLAAGGLAGLLSVVTQGGSLSDLSPEVSMRIERAKGQLEGLNAGLQAVGSMSDSVVRDLRALALLRQSHGLLGSLQWIDRQMQMLEKNETNASFDSELSLVYWSDYPLLEWLPNLMHYRLADTPTGGPPTLMVARLEAPTFERAKNLIDAAIATEKQGLTGKVYLDAGIKFDPKKDRAGSYGEYDQSLRDLAARLSKHTKLQVVLNDEAKLFQAGECPEAALYCGWYSLAKYVDAFDWQPGAVGYHMASSEAATLRKPGGAVWCNAMLEDGVAATLGPVQEPYLSAFPLPDDFFSLLLTGRYTLAEAYYRTSPYNSWVMVLVGDPLYNPFKNNPQLSDDALPERMKRPGPSAAAPAVSEDLPAGEEGKP